MAAAPVASQSYQPTAERFVRICPQHGTHLREETRPFPTGGTSEVLLCPRGHECKRWMAYDHDRSRLIGWGDVDQAHVVEGVCDDVVEGPRHERRVRVHRARKWDR